MTDAQKMLALAERMGYKALLGCDAFDESEGHNNPDGVYLCLDDGLQLFDPANNSEQAVAVWCWLIAQWGTTDSGGVIEVRFQSRSKVYGYTYKNTAEWRATVLKASLRVAGEK